MDARLSLSQAETAIFCAAQVERTTNHDVKAIEYVLKEKFRQHEELNKVHLFLQILGLTLGEQCPACVSLLGVHSQGKSLPVVLSWCR